MTTVEITPRATADVDAILAYLYDRAGRSVVDRQAAAFRVATRTLVDHPKFGRRRSEFGPGVRLVTIHPYVVLYRYDEPRDMVFVLRVLHGRRHRSLDAP